MKTKIKDLLLSKKKCDSNCCCILCHLTRTNICDCQNLTKFKCNECGKGICKKCWIYDYLCLDEYCVEQSNNYYRK